jgi:hypothetical protein
LSKKALKLLQLSEIVLILVRPQLQTFYKLSNRFMNRVVLLFLLFIFNSKLQSQTAVFIEKNGFVYSDTSSTPAINVLTGEVVRASDVPKDSLNIEKPLNNLPNSGVDLIRYPSTGYIIEPKKKQ